MKILLFVVVIFAVGCTTSYEKVKFDTFTPKVNSWEEVFQEAGDLTVEVWNTGTMTMEYDGVINVKDDRAKDLKGENTDLEVPVYYLTGSKRAFLIDAGLADDYDNNPTKGMSGLLSKVIIKSGIQKSGWSINERLESRGLSPDYIFLTHMHFDHITGLQDIKKLPPVISGEGENPINYKFLFENPFLDKVKDLREIDFDRGKDIYPFSNVVDVFGDGSFFAVSNKSGHTRGHVTFIANGVDGIYLFPGDQLNIRENIERGVGPGSFSSDLEGAQEHFQKITEFLEMYPETKIMYGHDIVE